MKKPFVEPELQRIELNLQENIASSSGDDDLGPTRAVVHFFSAEWLCPVITTGEGPGILGTAGGVERAEMAGCITYEYIRQQTRSMGDAVPLEDVLPYAR